MGTKINLYKQSGTDDGTSVNFNVPRSLTYGLNARANDDGGVTESDNCEYNTLNGLGTLLKSASLVLTPNSYKEGKLYSVIPNTGAGDMSVTRATTATRVNSDGLVELVPYNLLSYSEQFNNAAWAVNNATVTVNTTTAPNGTLTADTITNVSGSLVGQQVTNILIGQVFTFSIYLKRINGIGVINLVDVNGGIVPITITNEWHKYYVTSTSTSTLGRAYFRVMTTGDSVAAWGAQLVEGTSARDYLRTETRLNIPRLDYSLGGCPNILLEPQRTNLNTQSEDISTWSRVATTATINTTTAPNGMVTADSLLETTASSSHIAFKDTTGLSGTQYTFSIYAKSIGGRNIQVLGSSGFSGSIVVDLSNGNILSGSGVVSNMGDGWFRISITATTTTTTIRTIIYTVDGTTNSFAGDVTKGIYAWGAQIEAGSYATSYIPTTTASVTRNADQCVKTGISSLIGQTEGTMFIQLNMALISEARRIITLYNDINNYISLRITSGNSVQLLVVNASATQVSIVVPLSAGVVKLAAAYKVNDFVFYVNGIEVGADTNGTVPTTSSIYLGYDPTGASQIASGINAATLWKERLTNDQLASLTSL